MRDDTNEIGKIYEEFFSDIPPSPLSYITTGFKYTRTFN